MPPTPSSVLHCQWEPHFVSIHNSVCRNSYCMWITHALLKPERQASLNFPHSPSHQHDWLTPQAGIHTRGFWCSFMSEKLTHVCSTILQETEGKQRPPHLGALSIPKQVNEYVDNLSCSRNGFFHQNSISQAHDMVFTESWTSTQEWHFPGTFLSECCHVTRFCKWYL